MKKITHFVNFFALIMHAVNTLFNIYTLSEKMFDDTVIFFFSRWNGGGIAQSPSPPYIYTPLKDLGAVKSPTAVYTHRTSSRDGLMQGF